MPDPLYDAHDQTHVDASPAQAEDRTAGLEAIKRAMGSKHPVTGVAKILRNLQLSHRAITSIMEWLQQHAGNDFARQVIEAEHAGREGAGPDPTSIGAGDEVLPPNPNPSPPTNLLVDSSFDMTAWDSGTLDNKSLELAPWGSGGWGVSAATFNDGKNRSLGGVRAATFGGVGYLFNKEERGKIGFARFVQGDMWGGGYYGKVPWNKFEPVPIKSERRVIMAFDVYIGDHQPVGDGNHWLLQGLNVWFSGPGMPAGPDKTKHRPLVMDLVVENDCSAPGCGLNSFADKDAYHFQTMIAKPQPRHWQHVEVDLTEQVDAAWKAFGLSAAAREGLSIHQAEYVIECSLMQASALVDNIAMWEE